MRLQKFKDSCKKRLRTVYNFLFAKNPGRRFTPSDLPELNEIKERALKRSPINEHLETLFVESLEVKPKLIVELGVGGIGDSTFVLERVAKLSGGRLVSVDIYDRSHVNSNPEWIFVQRDDVAFAGEFETWCKERALDPRIDVLFIDTSHYFDHTLQEIQAYFPLLSDRAKVFFHDTNLNSFIFRKDRSIDLGWDNERGVIRALEVYFNRSFNEKEEFVDFIKPWLIKHHPYCSGFTVLEKLSFL